MPNSHIILGSNISAFTDAAASDRIRRFLARPAAHVTAILGQVDAAQVHIKLVACAAKLHSSMQMIAMLSLSLMASNGILDATRVSA